MQRLIIPNLEQRLDADQFINGGQVAVDLKHFLKKQ